MPSCLKKIVSRYNRNMPPRKKTTEEEEKPKVKRERVSKKHAVVAVVTQNGIQGMFTPEIRRPLIACLPIHSNEVQFYDQPPKYDPNPPNNPVAYEESMTNPFSEENVYESNINTVEFDKPTPIFEKEKEKKEKNKVVSVEQVVETVYPQQEYGPKTLLVTFSGSKDTKSLPMSTGVACFWCCETFNSRPCVIPMNITDDVWNVYGNFCTPNCASAYLLSDLLDTHVRWERLALLFRLYGKYCGGNIYPAPPRECLERFGGAITNQKFRAICEERKIRTDIHLPPMVSILASMDTKPIDFYETSLRNTTTVVQAPQVVDSTLKLKRQKPLKDRESTLDMCLNIKIKGT